MGNNQKYYDALRAFDEHVYGQVYGLLRGEHENNHALMKVIIRNEIYIRENPELMNAVFGLKLESPKIIAAIEHEIMTPRDFKTVSDMHVRESYYDDRGYHETMERALDRLNFELDPRDTLDKTRNGKPYKKHEIKSIKPEDVSCLMHNYAKLIMLLDTNLGTDSGRYSAQLNFSITDELNARPYNNEKFRELIGRNVLKFVDDGLVLLDTRASIIKEPSGGQTKELSIHRMETDTMDYLNTPSLTRRLKYQVAFRDEQNENGSEAGRDLKHTSRARHELRRMMPGDGPQNYEVCDSVLAATALITSAICHSFKTAKAEIVEPYNYRGTNYRFHMEKMMDSALLHEYFGKPLVDKLAISLRRYSMNRELDEKGVLDAKDFWSR